MGIDDNAGPPEFSTLKDPVSTGPQSIRIPNDTKEIPEECPRCAAYQGKRVILLFKVRHVVRLTNFLVSIYI